MWDDSEIQTLKEEERQRNRWRFLCLLGLHDWLKIPIQTDDSLYWIKKCRICGRKEHHIDNVDNPSCWMRID